MKGTRILRTIGAVTLSAAVGLGMSGLAHADELMVRVGSVGSEAAGPGSSVTVAKETLDAKINGAGANAGTTYYHVKPDLTVFAEAGVANSKSADIYIVKFTLDGMVFAANLGDKSLTGSKPLTGTGFSATKHSKGAEGDSEVTFTIEKGADPIAKTVLALTADVAVMASGGGSITRVVTAEHSSAQLADSETLILDNPVRVAPALMETAAPTDETATAGSLYMRFKDTGEEGMSTGQLGTFTISFAPGYLRAGAGKAGVDTPTATKVNSTVTERKDVIGEVGASPAISTVMLMGDVSFLGEKGKIGFSDGCSSFTDIRKVVNRVKTNDLLPQKIGDFISTGNTWEAPSLCISVDGETIINEGDYTVMATYQPLTATSMRPMGTEKSLGMIERDGTTTNIPYLTTYMGYNQRLVLRNLESREISYTVTFTTEDGVMADPKSVTDTLMAGEYKTLRVQDMTTLSGGSRTAATVTSTASASKLQVATTLVNLGDRSTDTQTHK